LIHQTEKDMKKVLGFTEDKQECMCCGKGDLKGTYALQLEEGGEILYYGSTCASKAYGFTSKEFKSANTQFNKEQSLIKRHNATSYAHALEIQAKIEEESKAAWAKFWAERKAS
jgi:hypothetical protein